MNLQGQQQHETTSQLLAASSFYASSGGGSSSTQLGPVQPPIDLHQRARSYELDSESHQQLVSTQMRQQHQHQIKLHSYQQHLLLQQHFGSMQLQNDGVKEARLRMQMVENQQQQMPQQSTQFPTSRPLGMPVGMDSVSLSDCGLPMPISGQSPHLPCLSDPTSSSYIQRHNLSLDYGSSNIMPSLMEDPVGSNPQADDRELSKKSSFGHLQWTERTVEKAVPDRGNALRNLESATKAAFGANMYSTYEAPSNSQKRSWQ
eukprot:CAMPEP_0196596528 /NCGR_PEP_ID=MMETSP1081-20130531/86491_1 /TAXON_ID=36882 /ORGANISM="Pyramimonas amylifera, Strain CCMP720" /LENGTH=259 /DNA_ID=CAMNT_0041921581 /DNA_START=21 /DNA_END=800 /DNA_ORIENTATION=+